MSRITLKTSADNPLDEIDIRVCRGEDRDAYEVEARHEGDAYEMGDPMGICVTMPDLATALKFAVMVADGEVKWPQDEATAAGLEKLGAMRPVL